MSKTYTVSQMRALVEEWELEHSGHGRDPFEVNHFLDWLEKRPKRALRRWNFVAEFAPSPQSTLMDAASGLPPVAHPVLVGVKPVLMADGGWVLYEDL